MGGERLEREQQVLRSSEMRDLIIMIVLMMPLMSEKIQRGRESEKTD